MKTSTPVLFVLLCLLCGLVSSVQADAEARWLPVLATNGPDGLEDEWPRQPANSRDATAFSLQGAAPASLRVGDRMVVVLPHTDGDLSFVLVKVAEFVNGDLVLHGSTENGAQSLTMTVGETAVFGQIEDQGQLLNLRAERRHDTGGFAGWLYQSDQLPALSGRRDYVVPQPPADAHRHTQELSLDQTGSRRELMASSTVSGAGVEIAQRFSVPNILVNEAASFELTVTVRNTAYSRRQLPPLEIFFLLEDMRLMHTVSGCTQRSNQRGQPFLRCDSGPAFNPGEVRRLTFRLAAGPEPAPGRLLSSAFVGELQHNAYVNVVQDIVAGHDSQGVSLFNAGLLENTTTDPLGNVIIDVLALYTDRAQALYDGQAESRINYLFSVANSIYRDSGVGITLRPVHHRQINYSQLHDMDTMLENLTYGSHPALSNVPSLREQYGADLVMLFTPLTDDADICGLANLGGFNTRGDFQSFDDRDFAHSVIGIDCPFSSVVAHEAGHNMGLTHSHAEDGQGGTFSFATGHAEHGLFATVMANPAYFGDAQRVARFSSPALNCLGRPCGVDHNHPDSGADAVRALNLVRYQIANYYPTRIAPLPSRQVVSIDGSATDARIAMAASADGGRTFVSRISPNDRVDVNAEFYIDQAHVGRKAYFHVVMYVGGQFLQWTADGHLLDWDGESVEAMVPFSGTPENLGSQAVVKVLEQVQAPADLVGNQLQVYVAYQLAEERGGRVVPTGDLIYTLEPLILDIVAP